MTLAELNSLPADEAEKAFIACCASSKWARTMVARRPFASDDELMAGADAAWNDTTEADWHEAFAAHPRIGARSRGWSAKEQAAVAAAADAARDQLERENERYEKRFGHIYIVCATGRPAEELLADIRLRLNNEPATELRVAAAEQHRITRLRLRKLLEEER